MSRAAFLSTVAGTVAACAAALFDGNHQVLVTIGIAGSASLLILGAALESYASEQLRPPRLIVQLHCYY